MNKIVLKSNPNVRIWMAAVEKQVTEFSLVDDFAGVLPVVGDLISLVIDESTGERDYFKVIDRSADGRGYWDLGVQPIEKTRGFEYRNKLMQIEKESDRT